MGCDIHLVVQVKRGSTWEIVEPPTDLDWHDEFERKYKRWWSDRNYDAFAILADVRNGCGVAGIPTGDEFVPVVAKRRGVPSDFPVDRLDELGEHSFHWLTLRELVDYPHWNRRRVSLGVIKSSAYADFVKKNRINIPPSEFCAGISGNDIRTLSEAEFLSLGQPVDKKTYVEVSWGETYAYSADRLYTHLLPALRYWADDNGRSYDEVRLVFGFDS